MAHLNQGITATGGCLCRAIRYTIQIPPLEERPIAPGAATTPIANSDGFPEQQDTRLPMVEVDHCTSCRLATGSIIQAWIVCPKSYVNWSLLPRDGTATNKSKLDLEDHDYKQFSTINLTENAGEVSRATFYVEYISSPDVHRGFCGRCGTTLTFCYMGEKPGWTLPERNFDISLGTLDAEFLEQVQVDRHGWWTDGINWIKELVRNGDKVNGIPLIRHPTGAVKNVMEDHEA